MGIRIEVLDPTPDCPASVVANQTLGSFKEPQSIRQAPHPDLVSLKMQM